MKKLGIFLTFLTLGLVFLPKAEAITQNRVITIEEVRLKNAAGQWISVLQPDKRVDTSNEEPSVSFFNHGMVPPSEYTNFEILIADSSKEGERLSIKGKVDFEPATIKQGSFVNINFKLQFDQEWRIEQVELNVDQTSRLILENEIGHTIFLAKASRQSRLL